MTEWYDADLTILSAGFLQGNLSVTSLNHGDLANTLKVFPNPVSDILILETKTLHQSYTIVDVQGTVVESGSIDASPMEMDFSHVAPGTYILQIDHAKTHLIVKH